MKTKSVLVLSLIAMVITVFFYSCNKSTGSQDLQPDYPQFIGTWEGTTSQNLAIKIGIMNMNGLLVVNTYKYSVIRYDSNGAYHRTKSYDVSTSTVVTSVVKKYFKFTPYDPLGSTDFLSGRFNDTTMVLTGQFSSAFPKLSGSGYDVMTGSYTATKVK